MPVLTNPKHERFAQELASGKSQTDAYQAAGYKPDSGAASRLSGNVSIAARVAELQSRAADGVVITRQWVIERLVENANRAMQATRPASEEGVPTGDYQYQGSVANRALELLGKEIGMFVDRRELTGKDGGAIEVRASKEQRDAAVSAALRSNG